MKIKYVGAISPVEVHAAAITVAHGDVIDVDDDLGALLLEQSDSWVPAPKTKTAPKDGE